MSKNIPATGKRVLITLASSEYQGKIGKLVEETTEGGWWVSLDKGHVLEVFALGEFEALPNRTVSHGHGASNPPFAIWE